MILRPNSIEAAAAELSARGGTVIFVETCSDGVETGCDIMEPLGTDVVAELTRRGIAIIRPADAGSKDAILNAIEASFGEHPDTWFGARFSTFEDGHLFDVLILGRDLFESFGREQGDSVNRTDRS